MPVTIDGTAGVTAPNLTSTTSSTLASMTQAVNLGSTGQIVFPATQNASSDANTLDDYEEGTFTPALSYITPGTLSVGYSSRDGKYTKIGNVVYVTLSVALNAFTKGTASGDLIITGLPFTSSSSGTSVFAVSPYQAATPTTAGSFPNAYVTTNATQVRIDQYTNNGVNSVFPDPDSNALYTISGFYFV